MSASASAVFLVARLLLMSDAGTELVSEHRAQVPLGGTGLVRETLDRERLPGAIYIYLSPGAERAPARAGEEEPPLQLSLRVALWDHAAEAAAGRPPRETSNESVEIVPGGSALVQVAEDVPGGRRLILSLSSPPAPDPVALPSSVLPSRPAPIGFRIEAYRGTRGARELLEQHILVTVERRPVTWESRWKRPLPRPDGKGIAYRDEGLTLRLLPGEASSGWVSVEAQLSAVLYARDRAEPLTPSSRATRTVALGIPFEISLELPGEEGAGEKDDEGGQAGEKERAERPSIIVEVTPYRPTG